MADDFYDNVENVQAGNAVPIVDPISVGIAVSDNPVDDFRLGFSACNRCGNRERVATFTGNDIKSLFDAFVSGLGPGAPTDPNPELQNSWDYVGNDCEGNELSISLEYGRGCPSQFTFDYTNEGGNSQLSVFMIEQPPGVSPIHQ